jgi:hypothetical protein
MTNAAFNISKKHRSQRDKPSFYVVIVIDGYQGV